MADLLNWRVAEIATDRKTFTLSDDSTYYTVNRVDFSQIEVIVVRRNWNQSLGQQVDIVQDPIDDTQYTVRLEGEPHNGDGVYKLAVSYTPSTGIWNDLDTSLFLTPTSEFEYSNMISELSEECCSVDFRMDRIMNLLIVGSFLDSVYVIKDRYLQTSDFSVFEAERLIRRIESVIE